MFRRRRRHGRVAVGAALALAAVIAALATGAARAEDQPQAVERLHNGIEVLLNEGDGTVSAAAKTQLGTSLCTTALATTPDVNTDCTDQIHNETSVAIDPTNALHAIEGANDYQLTLNGAYVFETIDSRARVTFDGGRTWSTYPLDLNSYSITGDPAVAFDAAGNAYYATLGAVLPQGGFTLSNADIVVNHSSDGGRTWAGVRVAQSSGSFFEQGVFNDKEYIAAWGNGNAIVTWAKFIAGPHGAYESSEIQASVTHNAGRTWSAPVTISGSAPFCTDLTGGNLCNISQDSFPAVAADGKIYVAFDNLGDFTNFRDQYLVVQVDPRTGARVAGPFRVSDIFDGPADQPHSVFGDPTLANSQFRTFSFGNIAADPTNAAHLAIVFTDMRNSPLPAVQDPLQAVTNSDVIVTQSYDGGRTWSAATALPLVNDQFQVSGAFTSDGRLRFSFFDRRYDAANRKYGYTVATETRPGSGRYSLSQVTTALSDPTQNDRWFSGSTPFHATSFLGDYSNIAVGGAATSWTDMRNTVFFPNRSGFGEDAYFAALR